jgi:hypothetical protein
LKGCTLDFREGAVVERDVIGIARLVASCEREYPDNLIVELAEHEDRAQRFVATPVLLKADVRAEVGEPEFALASMAFLCSFQRSKSFPIDVR